LPANLTPQYHEAEAKFRAAVTAEEKIAALEEMLAVIPKHKGTEKLQADIKRRISKLRQKEASSNRGKHGVFYHVEKEGAGQIIVTGSPNSGKSLIVRRLTNAEPEVAEYPFTTRKPMPGMMEFEDILIQLVDSPPIVKEGTESWVIAMPRSADAVLLVADLASDSVVEDVENVYSALSSNKIILTAPGKIISSEYPIGTVFRNAIIAANKLDKPEAAENLELLRELCEIELPIVPISALSGEGLEALKSEIFRMLEIVRVYTKLPGKPPDKEKPFVMKRGSTVDDLTAAVHRGFVGKVRFARAWGRNVPDGAMVGRDYELDDGDIIELHV